MCVSGTYTMSMGDRGRVVIPVELRDRLGLHEGVTLVALDTGRGLVLLTRQQLRDLVRADLEGLDLVKELVSDRRREAAADDTA